MNENTPGAATPNETREGQRIAKVMARAGLCSRRDAEAWILEGRVSVNGKILESPAFNVTADDDIRVDGKQVQEAERTRLFLFHKPRGLVTTARDPEGRSTIFDALPEDLPRVVAVGRLDINTEGLLLLTNDGGLARVLELPATAWLRRYRVRAHGAIEQAQLDALREGVTIDGVRYAGIEARLEREQGSNVWLMMGLREGKNREIKRVLEHLGMSVNRLIRVSFGPFELGDLAEGEVAEVRTRVLRDQLGAKLAREAGLILEGEIVYYAAPTSAPAAPKRGERSHGGGRPRPDRAASSDRAPIPKRARAAAHPRQAQACVDATRRGGRRDERTAPPGRAQRDERPQGPRGQGRADFRRGSSPHRGRGAPDPQETAARGAAEHVARPARGESRGYEKRPPAREGRPPRSEGRSFEKRAPAGEGRSASREGKPFVKRPFAGEGARPPRGEGRTFEKRAPSGEGRAPSREGKPFAKRQFGDGARPPGREGRTFETRTPSGEGRSFEKRDLSGERRAPREGKPFAKRPFGEGARPPRDEGKSFEKRSPSGEGRAPAREGRSFEKRAPSGEGRPASREGKPFGKRPSSGEGRSFEKRAPSGEGRAPSRAGKPPGKRPFGGGPGGKRPPRRP